MSSGETIDDLAGVRGTSADDPSGALRAQEAHDAGVVVAPVEVPTFSVHLEFRVHSTQETADELVAAIANHLSNHPLVVPPVALSLEER